MNRLVGNVMIIDSAMGNSLALTSANQSIQLSKLHINAIAVYVADTSTSIFLTGANTASDIIFKCDFKNPSATTGGAVLGALSNPYWFPFSQPQLASDLKAPIVTAGTILVYLA